MRTRAPSLWLRGGHLAALWSFAFVQPLFELLGRNADFFVARGNGRADILIFSIGFVLLPPAAMIAVEAITERVSRRVAWGMHLVFVALIVAAIALQALKDIASGPAALLIAAALVVGALASLAYDRVAAARSITSFLIPAPAVFLAIFLLFSDVSDLVLPQPAPPIYASTGGSGAPVVMVLFDEFPSATLMDSRGHINGHRFPHFAELAHHSTWYRNTTTVADHTASAVPAILTGSYPKPNRLPTASDQPHNLFTMLGDYRMNVEESVTQLCPTRLCDRPGVGSLPSRLGSLVSDLSEVSEHLLLPNSIAHKLPPVNETYSNFRSGGADTGDVAATGLRRRGLGTARGKVLSPFLDGISSAPKSLNFMHIEIPHAPWRNLPSGQEYQTESSGQEGWLTANSIWIRDRWVTDQGFQRHMLAAGFADHILGAVIRRLRQTGIWNRALFVVMADHGASFLPGLPRRNVDRANLGGIATPPLFIKAPDQRRGRIVDRHVRTFDVLPTIADLLGVKLPFRVDGRSALDRTSTSRVRIARSGGVCCLDTSLRAVERARRRVIARQARLFGSDTGWRPVWRIGPNSNLIGRRASSLTGPSSIPGKTASLMDRSLYGDIDPRGSFVPSLVRCRLSGVPTGSSIAVAVNGRIAAVTRSYDGFTGGEQAIALVPPPDFRRGANAVEVYLVGAGQNGRPTLTPLGGT